jgi:hypothetical protein
MLWLLSNDPAREIQPEKSSQAGTQYFRRSGPGIDGLISEDGSVEAKQKRPGAAFP